jgi:hypothetical protein
MRSQFRAAASVLIVTRSEEVEKVLPGAAVKRLTFEPGAGAVYRVEAPRGG